MPFFQIDFVRMQRYTTGVDAPSLEVAEFKAEQMIPEIEESDWARDEIDFVAMEYNEPRTQEEEEL